MRTRTIFLLLSVVSVGLAGCAVDDDDDGESTRPTEPEGMSNDTSGMCVEGAEDCVDTPMTETVDDPYQVGT